MCPAGTPWQPHPWSKAGSVQTPLHEVSCAGSVRLKLLGSCGCSPQLAMSRGSCTLLLFVGECMSAYLDGYFHMRPFTHPGDCGSELFFD